MVQKYLIGIISIYFALMSARAMACGDHLYINPDELGFFGGAVVRMVGLAPPEPVFELEHPSMAKAKIGENNELTVSYSRPFFSKNVRMELKGSGNVKLAEEALLLEDRNGSVTIPYQLNGNGFNQITVTVIGEHKGEIVRESGRVYIRAGA
ncbi:MAG: hypothetical protein ACR2QW_00780 [bacterium]